MIISHIYIHSEITLNTVYVAVLKTGSNAIPIVILRFTVRGLFFVCDSEVPVSWFPVK